MTASKCHKARANGEGTIYQRKDGRWEAAGYVLTADSNRGLPVATVDSTVGIYITYWLGSVAVH